MKILRKFGKFLLGFMFSLMLTITVFLYISQDMLSYDFLLEIAKNVTYNRKLINITDEEKEVAIQSLKILCQEKENIEIDFGEKIKIECKDVEKLSKENFENFVIETYFRNLYYKNYTCSLKECLDRRELTYFISFQFRKEIEKYLKLMIPLTLIAGLLYLIVLENWKERVLSFSISFIMIGITPIVLNFIELYFLSQDFASILNLISNKFSILSYFLYLGLFLIFLSLLPDIKKLLYSKNK